MSDSQHVRWPWASLFDWQETCWCPASSSPTLRCWSASPAIPRQPCTVSICSSLTWAAAPCPGITSSARCISTLPILDRKASTGDNNFQERKQAVLKPISTLFVVCKSDKKQVSANRGPDLTFAIEANIKSLCPKLSWGSILKSQNRVYPKHEYQPGSKMVVHQHIDQTQSTNCKSRFLT